MSGYYKITCFCKQCNGNNTETASGNIATEGITIAVHKSLYNEYGDGHEIKINGVGYREIQDTHSVGKNVIDVYVGDTNGCHCNSNPINGRRYVEF